MARHALVFATLMPLAHAYFSAGRCTIPQNKIARSAVTKMDETDDFSVDTRRRPAASQPGPGMSPCTIKVIGVGGGGGNTLNRMVEDGPGVERSTFLEYIAANTDVQALRRRSPTRRCSCHPQELGARSGRGRRSRRSAARARSTRPPRSRRSSPAPTWSL